MQLQAVELVGNGMAGTGQEARTHAPGAFAEPEVEAGRLHLVVIQRPRRRERAAREKLADLAIRKDPRTHAPAPLPTGGLARRPIDASGPMGLKDVYPVVIWPVGLQPR